MKKTLIILFALSWILGACKKNYTCECRNSNGTYTAGEVYETRKKGEDKCRDLSDGDTSCYAK